MDVRSLHAFAAVADAASMTAAAQRLGTVQPALSARIAALEAEVGEALFERLPRGMRLTSAGARLLPYVGRMEALLAEATAAARGTAPRPHGPLRLGAIEVVAASFLPGVLADFVRAHPQVEPRLRIAVSTALGASLAAGDLDAAIVAERPKIAALGVISLAPEPLVLAIPKGAKPERLDQAFVFGPGCICRARLEALLKRRRATPRLVEIGSVEAMIGLVAAGLGTALLPRRLVTAPGIDAEEVAPLDLFLVHRPGADQVASAFAASCGRSRPLSPASDPPPRRHRRGA